MSRVILDSDSLNTNLIATLRQADQVFICGEALSHCVNFTTRDLADNWPTEELHKLHVLTDCASSVGGFEESGEVCRDNSFRIHSQLWCRHS